MVQREYTVTVERTSHRRERMERRRRRDQRKRSVCGGAAMLCFFLLLGIVGGIEHDSIALGHGTLYMVLAMGAGVLFAWLAGGFDDRMED